jgi:lysophospholipase L1-like esterase
MTEYEIKVKRHEQLNKCALRGETVFAGSSLMEDFPVGELAQALPGRPVVYNRGIGGDTLDGFARRLDSAVVDLLPRRLFINIGTNDMGLPGYAADGLIRKYRAVLEAIRARVPGAEIVVMSYYPVNRAVCPDPSWLGARTNAEIARVNALLAAMAADMGLFYVDVTSCLAGEDGDLRAEYAVDGVHLYPAAYARVFKILAPYVVKRFNT